MGDASKILGSAATKHGEIAENVQVYYSNARRLIHAPMKQYSFETVHLIHPSNLLVCDIFKIDIQQKDGLKTLATGALGVSGATIVKKTIATNLLKLIPVSGTVAG